MCHAWCDCSCIAVGDGVKVESEVVLIWLIGVGARLSMALRECVIYFELCSEWFSGVTG